ncbi:hypothetical protein COSO111634_19350 [Corallococcus soli]
MSFQSSSSVRRSSAGSTVSDETRAVGAATADSSRARSRVDMRSMVAASNRSVL